MTHDIDKHIQIINDSLTWAKDYGKESFPTEQFKEYRRKLRKIRNALSSKCSAAAYGESQVGKSYLMDSLLSSADQPFMIQHAGRPYSFINDINPSGGNNSKIESTGVITRFTLKPNDSAVANRIKIINLSVVDIILLIVDSYYNDIKINPDTVLSYDAINRDLDAIAAAWQNTPAQHSIITEDDIRDIADYIKEVIGNNAASIIQSNFAKVAGSIINRIPYDKWLDIFSLLWNKNEELNRLFATLINAYKKLDFTREIYVPFEAVMRSRGTLLKIQWLDSVCGIIGDTGTDDLYTDVYDSQNRLIAQSFNKGELSALIAELTFQLPEALAVDRPFLRNMDLLDFPGARSREKYKEKEIKEVLPKMLRRGKVAYLFNKYSRSLQISSVLFCHHNDQKTEPTIGETISTWIDDNIGATPAERATLLRDTNGIAPLFMVATKFNIDLERTLIDKRDNIDSLTNHWKRFDTVLPEIIKPDRWLDEWVEAGIGRVEPFKNIYPLRDFYWSGKNRIFDGYSANSPELNAHHHDDFPDYMERLHDSFVRHEFVQRHFTDPERTWRDVATINNDGSKAIIANLSNIAGVLDNARRKRYQSQLENLKRELVNALTVYYEPEDVEAKNKKVRLIAGDIRRSLSQIVATKPAAFGRILDSLMLKAESLRNIAYDIIVCHTDTPRDYSEINFIRAGAGIDPAAPRDENLQRLIDYYILDSEAQLSDYLNGLGLSINDVISSESLTLSTIGDVVTKHIIDFWIDHLNSKAAQLTAVLPHADEVVHMLINLFKKLNVRAEMATRINRYIEVFDEAQQPNAIGDYAALTLNNFVTSAGRNYISDDAIDSIRESAARCRLPVDISPTAWQRHPVRQDLQITLQALDDAAQIINQGRIDISTLRKLPFWNNYQRWENLVIIGLIYSSDISHCDPVCNARIKDLIDKSHTLYNDLN